MKNLKNRTKREVIESFMLFFQRIKNSNHYCRLGKTFKTQSKKYFLDTGTGKIFEINNNVYLVLQCLFDTDDFEKIAFLKISDEELESALSEIKNAVCSENILLAPPVSSMVGSQTEDLEYILENDIKQVTLELTERCNLRCGYCIYNESVSGNRDFGTKDMTFETARKAIDFLAAHSEEKIAIGFYGGEPLLKYELIKKCVKYALDTLKNKDITFSMTTNLVLMTREKAEYFASINNFIITASIDGPEDVHNEYRKFPDGTGSFSKAIQGFKNLVEAYKDKAETDLLINMVTEGPNYEEKYEKIKQFFKLIPWIPQKIAISNSYASHGAVISEYTGINSDKEFLVSNMDEKDLNPLMVWAMKKENKNDNIFSRRYVQNELIMIHKRPLNEKPLKYYTLNGCCVPGGRRVYVTTNGQFLPCEKIGNAPYIGNVDKGVDYNAIKKHYVNDYINEAVKFCNDCWAINMCGNCYVNCYNEKGVDFRLRHNNCRYTRYSLEKNLIWYHEILETEPESLKYLNNVNVY